MEIIKQFRWTIQRNIPGLGTEVVIVIAEWSILRCEYEFFERDATGCSWYKVVPTEAHFEELHLQQSLQAAA